MIKENEMPKIKTHDNINGSIKDENRVRFNPETNRNGISQINWSFYRATVATCFLHTRETKI